MQRYIDIIKEVVDSAVDDDGGTAFSRFHQPVVATASLYVWFRTQTIELRDDGMVIPYFGVFRVFAEPLFHLPLIGERTDIDTAAH